jgi:hypothetical protein
MAVVAKSKPAAIIRRVAFIACVTGWRAIETPNENCAQFKGETAFSAEESDLRGSLAILLAVGSLIHAAIRPLLGIAFVVLYFDSKTGNDRS